MKKLIISLVILGLIGAFVVFTTKGKKHELRFKTETVSRGDITETVTASGTVNPVTNINVGTQVSGTIKQIYADFNSPVKKGQLLAQIDPALFEAQVAQASANLLSARANYQKIVSLTENDRKTYYRYKTLVAKNYIAKSELDQAEATYDSDKAQIDAANAQIAQAQAALKNNQTNLRYTRIISPVNGVVVSRNIEVGQTVAASFQTPTLFAVAQDLTKMQIDTSVAEADIGKVKVGETVEYTLDGYPDRTFYGKVKQIRISPTTVSNVVTYDVVINVDNKEFILKPGMTANVSVITSRKSNVILVSNASLRFTPFEDDDAPKFKTRGLWILNGEKPKRVPIKIGASDGTNTEIVSGNIKEGDQVIIRTKGKSGKGGMKDRPQGMRMF